MDYKYKPEHVQELLVQGIMAHLEEHPENLLCKIPRTEYPLLLELFEAGPTQYIERPYRGLSYLLMRLGLVPAFENNFFRVWSLIMPTKVKDIIRKDLPYFKKLYLEKKPFPTPEQYRQMRLENKLS